MNTRIAKKLLTTGSATLTLLFSLTGPTLADAMFPPVYYATTLTLRMANEDNLSVSAQNIAVFTKTQKALINLARGSNYNDPVSKDTVLAFRMDGGCQAPAGQWVVYDKSTHTDILNLTDPFVFPIGPLLKVRDGKVRGAQLVANISIQAHGSMQFGLNGGQMMASISSIRAANAIDDCPNSISGSLLGHLNITLTKEDQPPTTEQVNVMILDGSTFKGTRLPAF